MSTLTRVLIPQNKNTKPVFQKTNTILYNYWKPACFFAWFIFLLFEAVIEVDHKYNKNPLCPYTDIYYDKTYYYINYAVLGGFITTAVFTFLTILWVQLDFSKKLSLIVSLNIVSIGSIATFLSFYNWGGLCIDALGTPTPAAIWGEWISCAPLLIFVIVSITNKIKLSRSDLFLMFSFFLCILFGFFIIVSRSNKGAAMFWFIMSCITYIPILYLPFNYTFDRVYTENDYHIIKPNLDNNEENGEMDLIKYQRKHTFFIYKNLSYCLNIILPLYTFNFLVALANNSVSHGIIINIYQLLSLITKGLFIIIIMNKHIELYELALKTINYHIEKNRREFIKYIFHEVRNPLNSLTIGIDLLNDIINHTEKNDEYDEKNILVMMRASAEFMGDTLNNILSIQKMEEGLLSLNLLPMSFETCLRNVLLSVSGSLIKKNMILNTNISADIPKIVYGDAYAIEHVIINLISNAIKFSKEHTVIQIDIFPSGNILFDAAKKTNIINITINVSDQGAGISPENQAKLFKNFVQIDPAKLQKGQGSGLGLAYCKKVVELHGGKISVISRENIGSTFSIDIPFTIVLDQIVIANYIASQTENKLLDIEFTDGIIKDRKYNVLIVDDSEINCKMLSMLLRKLGFTANETAENGKIAVDKVQKSAENGGDTYDIIFIDNLMPEMNGVEATKIIRKNGFKNLIIGITGNIMDNDEDDFLNAGVDMICEKPLKYENIKKITRFIEKNGCISKGDSYQKIVTPTEKKNGTKYSYDLYI